jgi:glucose/mannose transport system permease protein
MRHKTVTGFVPHLMVSPAYLAAFGGYVGSFLWMSYISLTSSKSLPNYTVTGTFQYERLFQSVRWTVSLQNLLIIGSAGIALTLIFGTLVAIALDQKVKGEGLFRTIFLYPYSMSFIVTGLAWQWLLNPDHGIAVALRDTGLWFVDTQILARPETALWAIIVAFVWQSAGLTVVIVLSALRAVDADIWKAGKVDGIPTWRMYVSVVLPTLGPAFLTCGFLMLLGVVSMYELVIALTGGGPGISTEVPTKFIMDYLFERSNIGLAAAASLTLFLLVLVLAGVFLMLSQRAAGRKATRIEAHS